MNRTVQSRANALGIPAILGLVAVLLLSSCADESDDPNALVGQDAAASGDANDSVDVVTPDTSTTDTSTTDTSTTDTSTPDINTDAGPEDIGELEDTDPPDAGPPDVMEDAQQDTVADASDDASLPDTSADVTSDADSPSDADATGDTGPVEPQGIGELCFGDIWDETIPGPDYDQFEFTAGEHCWGTDHQTIQNVGKVVILGDSVSVGTPNLEYLLATDNAHFWRNKLAEWLTTEFGLDQGEPLDWGLWKSYDYFTGKGGKLEAGDFKNCAKWGARNDDLIAGGGQIPECFPGYPDSGSDEPTLVVFTMGGNDVSKISQIGQDASPEEIEAGYPSAWKVATDAAMFLEQAVSWLKDPAMFPNGSYVVFASPFEFTDSTGETDSCTPQSTIDVPFVGEVDLSQFDISVAALAGYGSWEKPEVQEAIVIWLLEEYMRIAVEYDVDLIWMLEHFCGHGFVATGAEPDTTNRCYRGPDAELWFDDTCIHPNSKGHNAIYEMFRAVIDE